jgi:hypothetical protein
MLLIMHIVAFFGALVLFAAGLAWWKVVRFPTKVAETDGHNLDLRRIETAARTTAIAFGLCAVAALMAVIDWFGG